MGLLAALLGLLGCDRQRVEALEEGVSTEAQVRAQFGEPERVWDEGGGARTFEYNRQPAGARNYMITLGPDGVMRALRQVLTPQNFAQIVPGMSTDEVRRRLGKPMKVTPFPLKNETHYDWRYVDGPNQTDAKIFTAVFDAQGRVASTQSVLDTTPGQGNSGP